MNVWDMFIEGIQNPFSVTIPEASTGNTDQASTGNIDQASIGNTDQASTENTISNRYSLPKEEWPSVSTKDFLKNPINEENHPNSAAVDFLKGSAVELSNSGAVDFLNNDTENSQNNNGSFIDANLNVKGGVISTKYCFNGGETWVPCANMTEEVVANITNSANTTSDVIAKITEEVVANITNPTNTTSDVIAKITEEVVANITNPTNTTSDVIANMTEEAMFNLTNLTNTIDVNAENVSNPNPSSSLPGSSINLQWSSPSNYWAQGEWTMAVPLVLAFGTLLQTLRCCVSASKGKEKGQNFDPLQRELIQTGKEQVQNQGDQGQEDPTPKNPGYGAFYSVIKAKIKELKDANIMNNERLSKERRRENKAFFSQSKERSKTFIKMMSAPKIVDQLRDPEVDCEKFVEDVKKWIVQQEKATMKP